jgi:uncharacterized protein YegP (UPF0339 family)
MTTKVTGYYQLIEGHDGAFMFTLRAGNHETVFSSAVFWSRQAALDGVALLRELSQQRERFVRRDDDNGNEWFELLADDGRVLGRSEAYASRSGLMAGIASVQRNAQATVFRGRVWRSQVALSPAARVPMASLMP